MRLVKVECMKLLVEEKADLQAGGSRHWPRTTRSIFGIREGSDWKQKTTHGAASCRNEQGWQSHGALGGSMSHESQGSLRS